MALLDFEAEFSVNQCILSHCVFIYHDYLFWYSQFKRLIYQFMSGSGKVKLRILRASPLDRIVANPSICWAICFKSELCMLYQIQKNLPKIPMQLS